MELKFKRRRGISAEKKKANPYRTKRNKTPDRESKLYPVYEDYYEETRLLRQNSSHEDRHMQHKINSIKNVNQLYIPFKNTGDADDKSIIYNNDYNFMGAYFQYKKNNVPEIFNFDLQVTVVNFIYREDLFKYVKYALEGFFDSREFYIERRYKEFIAYRKLLSQNFPGVFIPPIPPKKAFGNLEEGFVKLRKKFLQQFFNRICGAPHLAASNVTKLFLESRNQNFLELPYEIYFKTLFNIYDFYSNYFDFLGKRGLSQSQRNFVNDFYLRLIKTRDNMENFVYIAAEAENCKLEIENTMQAVYENFYEVDNDFIYDMFKIDPETRKVYNKDLVECGLTESMYRTKFEKPPSVIYEWANFELIDTSAMIEAISSLYKYQETFDKKFKLLVRENEELEKALNVGWVNSFLFSTDLKYLQNKTTLVENLKNEIDVLKKLIDLLYKILFYIEIPTFKKDKVKFYNHFLLKLTEAEGHSDDKSIIIYQLLRDHCINTIDIYENNIKHKKKDVGGLKTDSGNEFLIK